MRWGWKGKCMLMLRRNVLETHLKTIKWAVPKNGERDLHNLIDTYEFWEYLAFSATCLEITETVISWKHTYCINFIMGGYNQSCKYKTKWRYEPRCPNNLIHTSSEALTNGRNDYLEKNRRQLNSIHKSRPNFFDSLFERWSVGLFKWYSDLCSFGQVDIVFQ